MKKMQSYTMEEKPNLCATYIENITKTIHKLKLYEDHNSLSKTLPYLTSVHLKFPEVEPTLVLDTMKEIIRTRNEDIWMTNTVSAKEIPVWYICSQDLMKVTYEYIQRRL